MTTENIQQVEVNPIKLAFILDGEVADILHTDERLSAIFLSKPLVIDISDKFVGLESSVMVGAKYDPDTENFTNPSN